MMKFFKIFFQDVKEFVQLTNVQISEKRKVMLYFQLLILVTLIILQYFYPLRWIQFGIFPALLELALFYVSVSFLINIIRVFFVSFYRKKNNLAPDYYDNLILAFDNLTSVTIYTVFLILLFYLLGVDMKSFFTSIALFAVAITLIFKDIIVNFINGIMIMFSGNVKLRDYITVDNYKGRIINITLQNVELKSDDGDIIYVPNTIFNNKEMINYSKSNVKKIKYNFHIKYEFFNSITKLEKHLISRLTKEFENLVSEDNVILKIINTDKEGANTTLEILVTKYSFKIEEKLIRYCSYEIVDFISSLKK